MASEHQSVELDIPDESRSSVADLKENGFILNPVEDHARGEGLPYAPVDWPNPGDVWTWRVGKRKTPCGYMVDRYLYPPHRLRKFIEGKPCFRSLKSTQEFVQKEFPNADQDNFFASFSWKVPSKDYDWKKDVNFDEVMVKRSESKLNTAMKCKARNKMCDSQLEVKSSDLLVMDCDLCGSESGFCHDCCCILCYRSIDWAYGGYSFIRCEAKVSENNICGHAAHIECALRSYLAGTVGGSIGLDVEYHCRRCDNRTDLISHVANLSKTCEFLESRDDIEKILKMGLCILCGSQRETAIRLLNRIEFVLTKLRSGTHLKDIWNAEDENLAVYSGATLRLGSNGTFSGLEHMNGKYPHEPNNTQRRSHRPVYVASDFKIEPLKLDEEIEQVLQDLRSSQELEYRMAEERFNVQKQTYVALYKKLDADRSELEKRTAAAMDSDVVGLLNSILSTVNQLNQEVVKLEDMQEVAKGFGKICPSILKEYFGIHVDD